MATTIVEFFGFDPLDQSIAASASRKKRSCPFSGGQCVKTLRDGELSGVCTLESNKSGPVICCPIRLYAEGHTILKDVAIHAFGPYVDLHVGRTARAAPVLAGRERVAVFGKGSGGELRLPNRGVGGSYYLDWVLARLDSSGKLLEFVAVEVQSIDTTGNYQAERSSYLKDEGVRHRSTAGFNWENVNKRILPQLIYKGNVLQRERLCKKGLFFVSPSPVYKKIQERLGNSMLEYPLQTGSITFLSYDLGSTVPPGFTRTLMKGGSFTTSVGQVANALVAPTNLPDANVYELAINSAL